VFCTLDHSWCCRLGLNLGIRTQRPPPDIPETPPTVTKVPRMQLVLLDSSWQCGQVCCTGNILSSVLVVVIVADWIVETDAVPLVSAIVGIRVSAGNMVVLVSWKEKAV